MTATRRFSLTILVAALLPLAAADAQPGRDTTLTATDASSVTITRDAYGVPHISASTEVGLFYGQGFAAAEDRLFQMESSRRIALGREAEIYGPGSLADDRATITVIYTDAERTAHFNALSSELQTALTAYRDGINAYIAQVIAEPAKFKPIEFDTYSIPVVNWSVEDLIAIIQGFLRVFGENGGDELDRLQDLMALGQAAFDAAYPVNDPSAPTTITGGGGGQQSEWAYSGIEVSDETIEAAGELRSRVYRTFPKFGSFATIVDGDKSAGGNVMLLGAPQMGEPVETEPSRTWEVELVSPTIHVGGMAIPGAPGVIIGHNEHFAWTMTSGQSDNTDVYVEVLNPTGTQYLYNAVFQNVEVYVNSIPVMGQANDLYTHYRTVHGPVIAVDVPNQQAVAIKTTHWGEEMTMMQGLYDIWKASTLTGFEAGVEQIIMSFNVFYAGADTGPGTQAIKYWHAGRYQDRTDGVDPRLPHSGIGTEEWGGFIPFANLPQADGDDQDYFVNWNNKPSADWDQGDNMPWIVGNEFRDRVDDIDDYVGPTTPFSYANLKNISATINDHGTYTQAIEVVAGASAAAKVQVATFFDENLNPPGQSGFISTAQDTSEHFSDQWALHEAFGLKPMLFSPESLPVELAGVRALVDGSTVTLMWSVVSETDNAGFEVQRRLPGDGIAVQGSRGEDGGWQAIAFVEGRGTASDPKQYAHRLEGQPPGVHVFRLRQVDFGGASTYSASIEVFVGPSGGFSVGDVYPNPADSGAESAITVRRQTRAVVSVFDLLGRRVLRVLDDELAAGETRRIGIDTSRLPAGVYRLVVEGAGATGVRAFTVVH